jgi:hypothetical protein
VPKRTSSDDRVELIIKGGQGYVVARGVEQPENFDNERGAYVEVGPRHTVAFKITQAEAIDAAIVMLAAAGPHLKDCFEHQEVLVGLLEELGILEAIKAPK